MRISHFFIDRPIFASVVSIVFVILGAVAFVRLPIAQYPEIARWHSCIRTLPSFERIHNITYFPKSLRTPAAMAGVGPALIKGAQYPRAALLDLALELR
jgi:hypothetical protein